MIVMLMPLSILNAEAMPGWFETKMSKSKILVLSFFLMFYEDFFQLGNI